MKRVILFSLLFFALFTNVKAQVTLATWNFSGEPGNQSSTAASNVNTSVIASASAITRGSGLTAATLDKSINSSGWDATNQSGAISNSDYYTFNITAKSNASFYLSSLNIYVSSDLNGPTSYNISYQIGTGMETFLTAASLTRGSATTITANINQTIPQNESIIIKIYAWGANSGGTLAILNNTSSGDPGITALPITLSDFYGTPVDNTIVLKWITESEKNNAYMEVQRSKDGIHFIPIGQRKGHSISTEQQHYDLADKKPLPGINYYRLKQVDYDSSFEYHKIIAVPFNGKSQGEGLYVYPTEVKDQLLVALDAPLERQAILQIVDVSGRIVQRHALSVGIAQTELPVSTLPAGHYLLTLLSDQRVSTVRFVKVR